VETSAMVEQSKQQGSGVPYMYIVLVVAINYHHLLLANTCCFKMLKNFPQNVMPIQIPA